MRIDMSHIPNGVLGSWRVESFEVEENELSQRISFFKTGRGVPAGSYKRLMRGGTCVMSNTPDEIRDFMPFVYKAKGNVLINGLGLGVLLTKLLSMPEITSITCIEASEDVIKLVSPYFNDARLTIIHGDAYAYTPPKGVKYDAVWHDIWDYICSDNLPQMAKLHQKYARKTHYQDSWGKRLCQKQLKSF